MIHVCRPISGALVLFSCIPFPLEPRSTLVHRNHSFRTRPIRRTLLSSVDYYIPITGTVSPDLFFSHLPRSILPASLHFFKLKTFGVAINLIARSAVKACVGTERMHTCFDNVRGRLSRSCPIFASACLLRVGAQNLQAVHSQGY